MSLQTTLNELGISTISDKEFNSIYRINYDHLSQGMIIDWFDRNDAFLQSLIVGLFTAIISVTIVTALGWVPILSVQWSWLITSLVLSAIALLLMIVRYLRFPTKSDGLVVSTCHVNDTRWCDRISFPKELREMVRTVRESLPDTQVSLYITSMYLLYPGTPIETGQKRTLYRVVLSADDTENKEDVTLGYWIQKR